MTFQSAPVPDDPASLSRLPGWVTADGGKGSENVAFLAGARLALLDLLLRDGAARVPLRLLANRLALKAATASSALEGRLAQEADIRDAFHLTPAGHARGPDGDLLAFWRHGQRVRLSGRGWAGQAAALAGERFADTIRGWLMHADEQARAQGPLAASSGIAALVLRADDRAERLACLMSDIVLARALRWPHPLPLTALHLRRAALIGGAGDPALQTALCRSVADAIVLAQDLARRAAALRAIAPKLRAKGAGAAVDLFLTEDAVTPAGMLSPIIRGTTLPMTGRAARRFCDRLVALGVVRELTGRPSFRLYGIAP